MASQSFYKCQTKADLIHDDYFDHQLCTRDQVAFHKEKMGDIMYFHQAIKQPYAWEIIKMVMKELEVLYKKNHWKLIKQSKVLPGMDVQSFISALHCKQYLISNEIKGHNARLNIHGSKQVDGMNYYKPMPPLWHDLQFNLQSL